ncbi:3-hydroxyacyl-CoA dehydrogenase family protein [Streptomyces sp. C10]|uniref:3-hydroxyacyl-CoA dehydrogenase family protein n=1 Tax=Streptomyces sp. C10 TaxID=531941 RepID=UPI00397FC3ED
MAQRDQDLAGGQLPRARGCMNEECKEPLYAAPPLLARMVDAGRLGRKSGSGFYSYERVRRHRSPLEIPRP